MTDKELMELKKLTNQLLELNEQAFLYFKEYSQKGKEADFFETVKPFADRVKDSIEIWLPKVSVWLAWEKPDYLHKQQIDQMIENFEVLSVHCFQKDTKKKRFIERYKSIEYTLSLVTFPDKTN
ncbi:YppE family protein [Salipaludibacillus sp. CF4.18]|uniref:YppE family protein n=1 Tax=Salipaludibacillus sp. CF4.18 TaxID=3373081 RepID=UPI003EE564D7